MANGFIGGDKMNVIRRLFESKKSKATRLAEEAEARRLVKEAEAKRLAEEAKEKRLAQEAEAKRLAEEAEAKRVKARRLAEETLAKLTNRDPQVRRAAAEALKEIGDERCLEPLIIALTDSDFDVTVAAQNTLWKIDKDWAKSEVAKAAVPSLLKRLKDNDPRLRKATVERLGRIGDSRAVELMIETLKDEDYLVRKAAVEALNSLQWQPADDSQALLWAIAREDWDKLESLGHHDIEPIVAALKGSNEYGRRAAAIALGKRGDPRSVEPLVVALKDNDNDVWRAAVEALRKMGHPPPPESNILRINDSPRGRSLKQLFDYLKTHEDTQSTWSKVPDPDDLYMLDIKTAVIRACASGTLILESEKQIAYKDLVEELEKEGLVRPSIWWGIQTYLISPKGRDTSIVIEGS